MKKYLVFIIAVGLLFSIAGNADAFATYTYDGTVRTWSDVNKVWDGDDDLLCWAAVNSNSLSYTGWTGGTSYDTATEIFGAFRDNWSDQVGSQYYGEEWWFSGANGSQGSAGWAQVTNSDALTPNWGGFYSATDDSNNSGYYNNTLSNRLYAMDAIDGYVTDDRAIGITIDGTYGHALSVWGIDMDLNQIFITDGDDGFTGLQTYNMSLAADGWYLDDGVGGSAMDYTGFRINEVFRLNMSSGSTPNADWSVTPCTGAACDPDPDPCTDCPTQVPEPSTLILLGSGLIGLVSFRKKMNS